MAKKKATKSKVTKKKQPVKRVPWTKEERLEQLIFFSKRSMDGTGGSLDQLMQGQVDRAQAELKTLKAKK